MWVSPTAQREQRHSRAGGNPVCGTNVNLFGLDSRLRGFPKTLDGMDEMDKMDFAKRTTLQNAPHGAIRPQDDIE